MHFVANTHQRKQKIVYFWAQEHVETFLKAVMMIWEARWHSLINLRQRPIFVYGSCNSIWYSVAVCLLLVLLRWNKIRQIFRVLLSYLFGDQYNNNLPFSSNLEAPSNFKLWYITNFVCLAFEKVCIPTYECIYMYLTYALSFYSGIQDVRDSAKLLVSILNISKTSLECLMGLATQYCNFSLRGRGASL